MAEPRPIEYYKEMLETNPKWLGVQAREMLGRYAKLEAELRVLKITRRWHFQLMCWLETFHNEVFQDYCRRIINIQKLSYTDHELLEAYDNRRVEEAGELPRKIAALETEVEEWKQSFELYDKAMRRATKLWQEESGNDQAPRIWPDGAKLVVWLMTRLEAAEFWSNWTYPEGATAEQVQNELADFKMVIDEVSKVYDYLTGGRLSKPNTVAEQVIAAVEEYFEETDVLAAPQEKAGCDPDQIEGRDPWEREEGLSGRMRKFREAPWEPAPPETVEEAELWWSATLEVFEYEVAILEGNLYQALEREHRLQAALTEAGLEVGEPWDSNDER